jgi:hypothetical protein
MVMLVMGRYPGWLANRHSLEQYFEGVYRSRVLGREAILGFGNVLSHLWPGVGGFLLAWSWVNALGFSAASVLLWRLTAPERPKVGPLYLVGIICMAVSGLVITPYDNISYALLLAAIIAASAMNGPHPWLVGVLIVAATATRESAFVAVAVIVVVRTVAMPERSRRAGLRWVRRLGDSVVLAAVTSSIITYVVLKLTLGRSGGLSFFAQPELGTNLNVHSVGPLLLALSMVLAVRLVGTGIPVDPVLRIRRRALWTLCTPYLIVVAATGLWSEAPRLVMPLVLGECALMAASRCPGSTGRVPVQGGLVSLSRSVRNGSRPELP